jgi:hypothetical protein
METTRAKYPTNIESINTNYLNTRDTTKFFNNYFEIPVQVSSNVDSAIISYFETITENTEAARALASAVIYTSVKQGIDPMSTLDEFKKLPNGELDAYTAMFLNFERVGTSYLGITNLPQINKYISRCIRP